MVVIVVDNVDVDVGNVGVIVFIVGVVSGCACIDRVFIIGDAGVVRYYDCVDVVVIVVAVILILLLLFMMLLSCVMLVS